MQREELSVKCWLCAGLDEYLCFRMRCVGPVLSLCENEVSKSSGGGEVIFFPENVSHEYVGYCDLGDKITASVIGSYFF